MTKRFIVLIVSVVLLLLVLVLIQWRSELDINQERFKPLTPKDAVHLPPLKRLMVNVILHAVRFTGSWNYPRVTDGDFPNMTFVDKLYWLYKSQYPVRRGEKGKNLEAFFAEHRGRKVSLPSGFIPKQTLTLSAVGDLMQHDTLAWQDYSPYRTIADTLFSTDISFANLESPLTGQDLKNLTIREDESPSLCISQSQFERLKGCGSRQFTVMATASNHSLDFGEEGVLTRYFLFSGRGLPLRPKVAAMNPTRTDFVSIISPRPCPSAPSLVPTERIPAFARKDLVVKTPSSPKSSEWLDAVAITVN